MLCAHLMRTFLLSLILLPALALAEGADTYAKIDALLERRDDPTALKEVEAELEAALKASPEDFGLLVRQARFKYWLADSTPNGEPKKRLGKELWSIAERMVKLAPGSPEGHYYAALGIGAYSEAVGIINALAEGLEGKFNTRLDKAIQLAPSYDHAGPLIAKGRYFQSLPWPMRNYQKAIEFYQKAIAKNPEALRAYHYLAETQLRDGKAKAAKETVAKAVNGAVEYDPPEGRRVRQMAAKLQADIQKALR